MKQVWSRYYYLKCVHVLVVYSSAKLLICLPCNGCQVSKLPLEAKEVKNPWPKSFRGKAAANMIIIYGNTQMSTAMQHTNQSS